MISIVNRHAEEISLVWELRAAALSATHLNLRTLTRLDDRIAIHFDGLRVASEAGWQPSDALLPLEQPGEMFAAMLFALEMRDQAKIYTLLSLAETLSALQSGLLSAFGWVSAHFLRGTARGMLSGASEFHRQVAIACCAMHGVDPRESLDAALGDSDARLRSRALRAAGTLGRRDLLPVCQAQVGDEDPACGFRAASAAVLLGDRGRSLDALLNCGLHPGPNRARAFQLALQAMDLAAAHVTLQHVSQEKRLRWLIEGTGIAGDPAYVPWIITQMRKSETARLAAKAFSLITGTDLGQFALEAEPPQGLSASPNEDPNEDPNDPNVEMDPDDGLPWPDPERIQTYWAGVAHRFQPGTRYFIGSPLSREHCVEILKRGYQQQRMLAAHYLCLLNPGTPLFNLSAPAWRQQRLLAQMS